jgi:hypothetical protein
VRPEPIALRSAALRKGQTAVSPSDQSSVNRDVSEVPSGISDPIIIEMAGVDTKSRRNGPTQPGDNTTSLIAHIQRLLAENVTLRQQNEEVQTSFAHPLIQEYLSSHKRQRRASE